MFVVLYYLKGIATQGIVSKQKCAVPERILFGSSKFSFEYKGCVKRVKLRLNSDNNLHGCFTKVLLLVRIKKIKPTSIFKVKVMAEELVSM